MSSDKPLHEKSPTELVTDEKDDEENEQRRQRDQQVEVAEKSAAEGPPVER